MDKEILKFILGGFLVTTIILLVIYDKKKIDIIHHSLKPDYIKFYLLLTILFYVFVNNVINNPKLNIISIDKKEYRRIKDISHQALFGLIIAIFAHLHLFITPFWLIFFLMYFNILDPIH